MITVGNINRYSSKEEVEKELIENRGWSFLKTYNCYSGECTGGNWWNSYSDGWKYIWKDFLLKVGLDVFENLPNVRPVHKINEYKSLHHLIYKYTLERGLVDSEVKEASPTLSLLDKYTIDDLFDEERLGDDVSQNPDIPSGLYRITPKQVLIDYVSKYSNTEDYYYKTASVREKFRIWDTKEKYGQLRVDFSGYTDKLQDICWSLEHISEYTCQKCGAQPKDSRGEHIIWQSKGYWIEQKCKRCAREECYIDRAADRKDTYLTHRTVGDAFEPVDKMMQVRWAKRCDRNKVTLRIYKSGEKDEHRTWNPWQMLAQD